MTRIATYLGCMSRSIDRAHVGIDDSIVTVHSSPKKF